ncbi:alpha/beta hydrolase [Clostridium tetanomorphum]|uniref:Alpha/beta hydrolase n=1 Tax=Clostridium tetanomorphum TaxID=1553 RepID=A0A923J1R9_CLOTT|nr:alpha/beta hydrolase [Clostridium tetanomorphum]MBC2397673.1 alpha/beta hydrolase [Clostridium tetanomorphum]NRZ96575.1 alpha-beta hydrolase superfamily lysophospholipase [Clostridium tetanomorphum]
MKSYEFNFKDGEGIKIHAYKWMPEESEIRAVVQLVHGMEESGARYERFARKLTKEGFAVYINDHRGHGKTACTREKLGYLGDGNGFNWLVADIKELNNIIKQEYKSVPIFLFGHSMGSFIVQKYVSLYGEEVKGIVLSGTNGKRGIELDFAILMAKYEMKKYRRKTRSRKLNNLCFFNCNKNFPNNKTEFDWLSRDEKEVEKYINDPLCGHVATTSFFYDLFTGIKNTYKKASVESVPKKLPIFILGGTMDPIGQNGKGVLRLYNMYKKMGMKNITCKLYEGGRHEMINETNREEVMKDIIYWLNKQLVL